MDWNARRTAPAIYLSHLKTIVLFVTYAARLLRTTSRTTTHAGARTSAMNIDGAARYNAQSRLQSITATVPMDLFSNLVRCADGAARIFCFCLGLPLCMSESHSPTNSNGLTMLSRH